MCGNRLNGTELNDRLQIAINHARECSVLLDQWTTLAANIDFVSNELHSLICDSIVEAQLLRNFVEQTEDRI